METEPTIFVVDDEEQSRASVCALVQSMGMQAESFSSAEQFLCSYREGRPGCLVTDVRMPGLNGLELQEELQRRDIGLPLIVITAYARTSSTVRAVQRGAVAVLDKPYENDDLAEAIRTALTRDAARRSEQEQQRQIHRRIGSLTPSERKVLDLMVRGLPNKSIAKRLNVSVRTVESRRHAVFSKMQAPSVVALMRVMMIAELDASPHRGA